MKLEHDVDRSPTCAGVKGARPWLGGFVWEEVSGGGVTARVTPSPARDGPNENEIRINIFIENYLRPDSLRQPASNAGS